MIENGIIIVIVVVSGLFIVRRFWRQAKGSGSSCGCSGGGCGGGRCGDPSLKHCQQQR